MPFYTPPGMANSLYLAMLRQQQQDLDNQQSRFDADEDRRMKSMYQVADLQLRKQEQKQTHEREMEKLGLQKEANYRQAVMEQQAGLGREKYKQRQITGREEAKETGRDVRAQAKIDVAKAALGLKGLEFSQRTEMDKAKKALIQAKTGVYRGIGRDKMVMGVITNTTKGIRKQAAEILASKPSYAAVTQADLDAYNGLMEKAATIEKAAAAAAARGPITPGDIDSILGLLDTPSATPQPQGGAGGGFDLDTIMGEAFGEEEP